MMTHLLRAEWLRLVSYRLVWVLTGLVMAFTVINAIGSVESTRPITDEDRASAQAGYEHFVNEVRDNPEPFQWEMRPDGGEITEEDIENYLAQTSLEEFMRETTSFQEYLTWHLVDETPILLHLSVLVGGMFLVAGDFRTGTIATQLTFTPQRHRVGLAKILTAGLWAGISGVLVLGMGLVAAVVAYLTLNPPESMVLDSSVPLAMLRVLALCLPVGMMGAIVTIGFQSAAIGGVVLVGVLVTSGILARFYWGLLDPIFSAYLTLTKGRTIQIMEDGYGTYTQTLFAHPAAVALTWVVLLAVVTALGSLALWRFSRVDLHA